jgi:hypothetical protein
MLAQLFDSACSISPTMRRFLIRNWFQYLSTLDKEAQMTFMNLGYAPLDMEEEPLSLLESDFPRRYWIQMYHHVASAIDLDGIVNLFNEERSMLLSYMGKGHKKGQ